MNQGSRGSVHCVAHSSQGTISFLNLRRLFSLLFYPELIPCYKIFFLLLFHVFISSFLSFVSDNWIDERINKMNIDRPALYQSTGVGFPKKAPVKMRVYSEPCHSEVILFPPKISEGFVIRYGTQEPRTKLGKKQTHE